MKKVFILGAAITMLAQSAQAQIRFAPEVGLNLNNLYANSAPNYVTSNQIKVGFNGGVIANVPLGKSWALQPGVKYSLKGGEIQTDTQSPLMITKRKDKISLHYIEVPVDIVYKTGTMGSNRFFIGAGPYIAFLVDAERRYKLTTNTFVGSTTETTETDGVQKIAVGNNDNNPDNYKALDYGANGFIGYEMPMGLYLKAGASIGFNNIQPTVSNTLYTRNYNFSFTVGYFLGKH